MKLRIDWKEVLSVGKVATNSLESVLRRHQELFKEELGMVKGMEVSIHIEPDAHPRFYRVRPVPYLYEGRSIPSWSGYSARVSSDLSSSRTGQRRWYLS